MTNLEAQVERLLSITWIKQKRVAEVMRMNHSTFRAKALKLNRNKFSPVEQMGVVNAYRFLQLEIAWAIETEEDPQPSPKKE